MNKISKKELEQLLDTKDDIQLIDVRESYEFEDKNIGGINIPLDDVLESKNQIASDKKVIFCCKSGKRSSAMASTLERKFGMKNLYTLEGGLTAYFGE